MKHIPKSALWFTLYAQWTTIIPIVVPDQVTILVGSSSTNRELILGTVLALGAIVALVVAPIAGALSDHTVKKSGRRGWYLATGTIGGCITLIVLGSLDAKSGILAYSTAFMIMQFWWNWTAGPYAALIPDTVPSHEIHMASAWLSALSVLGNITGNALIMLSYAREQPMPLIISLVSLNACGLLLTLWSLPASTKTKSSIVVARGKLLSDFFPSAVKHPNFYRVLVGRFCCNMGVWSVFSFLLYYLQDVIQVERADKLLSSLLAVGAAIAVPAAIGGGWLAGQFGYVRIARAASWLMAAGALSLLAVAVSPSPIYVVPAIVVFSGAYGAYLAVDWALALAVLPDPERVGKDMGIWHVSVVLPQVIGPVTVGLLITTIAEWTSKRDAYIAAFAIAACWLVLSAASIKKVFLPQRERPLESWK